jgi:hypothetical protein
MSDLDERARQAAERVDQLNPHIDHLRDALARVEKYLARDMEQAVKQSDAWVKGGLAHAANLEQMLAVLLKTVMDSNAQVAAAQTESVELVARKANDELSAFVGVIASAAASSIALQNQLVSSEGTFHLLGCLTRKHRKFPASRPPSSQLAKTPSSKESTDS